MNTIDTRDLQKRMDELEELRDAIGTAQTAVDEAEEARNNLDLIADATEDQKDASDSVVADAQEKLEDAEAAFGKDERDELAELEEIASEVSDFRHGETLVPVSDFTDYVREMLHDCGDVTKHIPHYVEIDWEATADNVKADYTEVRYLWDDYLVRA